MAFSISAIALHYIAEVTINVKGCLKVQPH